jgi:hypothetical protein
MKDLFREGMAISAEGTIVIIRALDTKNVSHSLPYKPFLRVRPTVLMEENLWKLIIGSVSMAKSCLARC